MLTVLNVAVQRLPKTICSCKTMLFAFFYLRICPCVCVCALFLRVPSFYLHFSPSNHFTHLFEKCFGLNTFRKLCANNQANLMNDFLMPHEYLCFLVIDLLVRHRMRAKLRQLKAFHTNRTMNDQTWLDRFDCDLEHFQRVASRAQL